MILLDNRATIPTSEENVFPYFNVFNNTSNHSYIVHKDIIYLKKDPLFQQCKIYLTYRIKSERILMEPDFH